MVRAVVTTSVEAGIVTMDQATLDVMHELRDFMFDRVYLRSEHTPQKDWAMEVTRHLTDWFHRNPDQVPESYKVDEADDLTRALDYVSGMTDRYAIRTHDALFRPTLFD